MRTIVAVLAVLGLAMAAKAAPTAWPDGKRAAVVLTYDDALASQLDIALPALDAAGLKATFFVTGAGMKPQTVARWRAAATAGHELGNHTVFHACPRALYPAAERNTTEAYTVETMLSEIAAMNTMLTAIDGRLQHSYATPCGEHRAGGVDYNPALKASGLVRYERGTGYPDGRFDPMDMPSRWFDDKSTGADMIAAVTAAEQKGELLVIGFHGVGGDYLSVTAKAHAELLAWLKAHQSTIWVAPFSTVMDYATAHR